MTKPAAQLPIKAPKLALLMAGAIILGAMLSAGFIGTFLYDAPDTDENEIAPIIKTGMETLEDYRCMKAETKQVLVRGVEDNYAVTGDEDITYSPVHAYLFDRTGKKSAVTVDRAYDEGGMDRFLLDQIMVPSGITRGLLVIKMRSLTPSTNDSINVGDMARKYEARDIYGSAIAQLPESDIWTIAGGVYSADLKDLTFKDARFENGEPIPRQYDNALEYLNDHGAETKALGVFIGDDHIVDFIGVAICQPPTEARGVSLLVEPVYNDASLTKLSCIDIAGLNHCDPYKGDTLCSEALPLACLKADAGMSETLSNTALAEMWSGAEVKFTTPIRGDTLTSSSEAHAACAARFGTGYRMATHQERLGGITFVANGRATVSQAWIHAKTEPYGNCWSLNTHVGPQASAEASQ